MGTSSRALHQVEPREQVGAQTGALYDYQYHQAAAAALSLVDDTGVVCIYCEWHDDYVTESESASAYRFHQVKHRAKSKGPWRLSEFFGVPKKLADPAHEDSIFARLWDHGDKFGDRCQAFVFVTDAAIDPFFEALLFEAQLVRRGGQFADATKRSFDKVYNALKRTFTSITEDELLVFLTRLVVQDGIGKLEDLNGCRLEIAARILDASEVDLKVSEARKIGEDLVSAVRERSHHTLASLPATPEELRASKGLIIDNVLRLLSLSQEGYRELKSGGRTAVRTLSRLQRLCARSGVPAHLIPDVCRFKTGWDAWWLNQQHLIDRADYLALKLEAANLLRLHTEGHLLFANLIEQAKGVAHTYAGRVASSKPLTGDLVLGLVFSLAAEAEA